MDYVVVFTMVVGIYLPVGLLLGMQGWYILQHFRGGGPIYWILSQQSRPLAESVLRIVVFLGFLVWYVISLCSSLRRALM